jgi:tetratricopeptide (TPR) repeat protein
MNPYKNYLILANSYSIISTAYDKKKEYKQSLNYSFKALEIAEENFKEKSVILAGYYHDIAITYYHLKNYENANYYIDKAIINYLKQVKTQDSFMQKMLTYKSIFTMYCKLINNFKKYSKYFLIILIFLLIALISYFLFIKWMA